MRIFSARSLYLLIFFIVLLISCTKNDWPPACAKTEILTATLDRIDYQRWSNRVRMLSGVDAMVLQGTEVFSSTRYTPALFSGAKNAPAYRWLHEQLSLLYPATYIEDIEFRNNYLCEDDTCSGWRNLILTIPGKDLAEEELLITAHLDSLSLNDAASLAPGADDNASGAAALMEIASIVHDLTFRRTLKIIWFTGEEQGLTGSSTWAGLYKLNRIRGVINIDSIARDQNADFRMEIHAGKDSNSLAMAECITTLIPLYQPNLVPELLIGEKAAGNSDHSEFWHRGVAAIMLSEDMCAPGSCIAESVDANQLHHTDQDTWDSLTPEYGFAITKIAIAAAISLAEIEN